MATINPPTWMQGGSYPARNDRLALTSLLSYSGFAADEATPMRIRPGVKPSYQNYQMKVRPAGTPNMTVLVSAGFCYMDQRDTGGVGTYVCVNDADVTLTVQPAGGAGQFRKDTVVASVYDSEYAGSANEWRLEVIQGPYAATAAATTRGALPANSQVLADIAIAPNQTSVAAANITDVRQYSVPAGGIVPVSSAAAPPRLAPGQMLYLMDTDRLVYGKQDGTTGEVQKSLDGAWTPYTPVWAASGTAPSVGSNGILVGRYMRIGRMITAQIDLTTGSATTYGSGNYNWTVPFPAASVGINYVGQAHLLGNFRWVGQTILSPGANNISAFFPQSSTETRTDFLTATRPESLNFGTRIRLNITYEAAS